VEQKEKEDLGVEEEEDLLGEKDSWVVLCFLWKTEGAMTESCEGPVRISLVEERFPPKRSRT